MKGFEMDITKIDLKTPEGQTICLETILEKLQDASYLLEGFSNLVLDASLDAPSEDLIDSADYAALNDIKAKIKAARATLPEVLSRMLLRINA